MSKEITARLLKNKIDTIKNLDKKKEYLINCLKRHGKIKEEETIDVTQFSHDICKLCNSNNFIFNRNEKVCGECGASTFDLTSNPYKTYKMDFNLSKGSFIEPGTLMITVNKDGKQVSRDLSKLNTWLSSDPEEQKMKLNLMRIKEIIEKIEPNYNQFVFEKVSNEIISMWYNVLSIKPNIRGVERVSLMAWCIYYPIVYNNLNINIQKIVSMLDITVGDAFSYNFVLKDIFSNTPYEKYISIPVGNVAELDIPENIKIKINVVKRDLKDYLSNPLKDKEYFGIVYYISKLKGKAFTLGYLSEKSGISTTIISNEASKIERFYNSNPGLKKRL